MIIDIHPLECALHYGEDVCCRWTVHRFYPCPATAYRTERGFVVEMIPGKPIAIRAYLAALSGDGKWLELGKGRAYDAATILAMAERGNENLKFVGPADAKG